MVHWRGQRWGCTTWADSKWRGCGGRGRPAQLITRANAIYNIEVCGEAEADGQFDDEGRELEVLEVRHGRVRKLHVEWRAVVRGPRQTVERRRIRVAYQQRAERAPESASLFVPPLSLPKCEQWTLM
jgi:hypothetical protein